MSQETKGGSASIGVDDYWWYRVRTDLLHTVFAPYVANAATVLDVGSADGPSVGWLRGESLHVNLDLDRRGLVPGRGVCGSALALPFADGSFDVVGAFDVIEHCDPESDATRELARVLRPGGRLLVSVPAYQWAWSDFDVANGHHRRYTRGRAVRAIESAGLRVERATYAFGATFPMFAAERLLRKTKAALSRSSVSSAEDIVTVPEVSDGLDRMLSRMGRVDRWLLSRTDLGFGSSVFVAASKPR